MLRLPDGLACQESEIPVRESLKKLPRSEPFTGLVEPTNGTLVGILSVAETMTTRGIFLQNRGNAGLSERLIIQLAILRRNQLVIQSMHQDGRRGIRGDLGLIREGMHQGWIGVGTQQIGKTASMSDIRPGADDGINKNSEIGTAATAVNRITRIGITHIEMR